MNEKYLYIPQITAYGCGVFAVMNALNYELSRNGLEGLQCHYDHMEKIEKTLNTDEERGTDEKDMIRFLRKFFYVSVRYKFSKKYLDKWIKQGNQAIIMYPYAGKYELHYSNIFQHNKNTNIYSGANFWWRYGLRWSMRRTCDLEIINTLYRECGLVMYLRWRGDVQHEIR